MLDAYKTYVTEAGFAAALASEVGGFKVNITHVAVGTSGYEVTRNAHGRASQTALRSEQERVSIRDAREVGAGQTDISFLIDGPSEYYVREVGFYTDGGVLFAVASHPNTALIWKSPYSIAAIAMELVLESVDPENINITSNGAPLNLLMTREFAVLSTSTMRLSLEQLKLQDHRAQDAQHIEDLQQEVATLKAKNAALTQAFNTYEPPPPTREFAVLSTIQFSNALAGFRLNDQLRALQSSHSGDI